MIYIWCRTPSDCPNKLIGAYEWNTKRSSSDWLWLTRGKKVENNTILPFIKFSCKMLDISKYDCLPNSSGVPVFNKKLRDIFDSICPCDVQYFDLRVECNDGFLEGYKIVNITHEVKAIDHKQSRYRIIAGTEDKILGFDYLVLDQNCLIKSGYEIARDAEYHSNILVEDRLFSEFKKHNIKGVRLITVDEYNAIGY